ncbi:hypothetical protein EON63_23965 [archaeon]|nr:MAG: hypothetical protein EON63_23965 [archaeon]
MYRRWLHIEKHHPETAYDIIASKNSLFDRVRTDLFTPEEDIILLSCIRDQVAVGARVSFVEVALAVSIYKPDAKYLCWLIDTTTIPYTNNGYQQSYTIHHTPYTLQSTIVRTTTYIHILVHTHHHHMVCICRWEPATTTSAPRGGYIYPALGRLRWRTYWSTRTRCSSPAVR